MKVLEPPELRDTPPADNQVETSAGQSWVWTSGHWALLAPGQAISANGMVVVLSHVVHEPPAIPDPLPADGVQQLEGSVLWTWYHGRWAVVGVDSPAHATGTTTGTPVTVPLLPQGFDEPFNPAGPNYSAFNFTNSDTFANPITQDELDAALKELDEGR